MARTLRGGAQHGADGAHAQGRVLNTALTARTLRGRVLNTAHLMARTLRGRLLNTALRSSAAATQLNAEAANLISLNLKSGICSDERRGERTAAARHASIGSQQRAA